MAVPINATILLTAASYSAICYAVTKGCEFLCSRPVLVDGVARTSLDQVREYGANLQENVARLVGERNWEIFSALVIDNAWISTFVFTLFVLLVPIPDTWEAYYTLVAMFPVIGIGASIVRLAIRDCLPPLANAIAQFAAPRRYQN